MAATTPDFEQAGELKIGQVGIANLRIRTFDIDKLVAEMRERVRSAPKLFERAAVILDFGGLARTPDAGTVKKLVSGLQQAGVMPVAIAYGTTEIEALSKEVGLPLLAKFRVSYEKADSTSDAPAGATSAAAKVAKSPIAAEAAPAKSADKKNVSGGNSEPGLLQTLPVRSGQQVYAQNRDLTVCATVGAGAEVISDGSIHIYGALRGRALAGANGNANARIFCREFHAELVAVAGTYKVLDEIPKHLLGKAVQIWLDKEQLRIEELP
jgi:septum site-determining protein MinC